MADDLVTFCDSDEEVFLGGLTEKEILKSTALGQNYCSPVATCSTPRPKATNLCKSALALPDVLQGSNNRPVEQEKPTDRVEDSESIPANDSASNSGIIMIDAEIKNDSVQIISDDESFLQNENFVKNKPNESNLMRESDYSIKEGEVTVEISTNRTIHNNSPIHSGLSSLDNSLLNGVSDSILNVSYGSSLNSPITNCDSKTKVINENIICNEDHLEVSGTDLHELSAKSDDLHMSIDEPDSRASIEGSQQSVYNSCLSASCNSSYFTATNYNILSTTQQSSGLFSNYRDTMDGMGLVESIDELGGLEIGSDSKSEISFEMITQNRQNSFTDTSSLNKPETDNSKAVKQRAMSKLPVFKSSSSLLKPSKLNIKTDCVTRDNFKWAMNLQKTNADKREMSLKKRETKIFNIKAKVPLSFLPSKPAHPEETKTVSKTPAKCTNLADKTKTPIGMKLTTPGRSDSKIPTPLTPFVKSTASSGKEENSTKQFLFPTRSNQYNHIVSPIRAYITGSSVVLQQKAQIVEQEKSRNVGTSEASHIPKRTPLKVPKAVQKLDYGNENANIQGQENVDPIHFRDTLPPRVLESAAAVFVKEAENARQIPKHLHSLLNTPRPKVITHQGRVRQSPNKVLVPNNSDNCSTYTPGIQDISVRVVRSAEKTNTLK